MILSRARSGTQLLSHSLAPPRNKRAVNRGECFIRNRGTMNAGIPIDTLVDAAFPSARDLPPPTEMVVAVVHGEYAPGELLRSLSRDPDITYVILRRRIFARHVSLRVAWKTQVWASFTQDQIPDPVKVTIKPDELAQDYLADVRIFEDYRRWTSELSPVVVSYEELAASWPSEVARVCRAIGIPQYADKPATWKQIRKPLSAVVENYHEIREQFKGEIWWHDE